MIVTCPNCSTSFNLSAEHRKEQVNEYAILRCSQCKTTFALPHKEPILKEPLGLAEGTFVSKKEGTFWCPACVVHFVVCV